jgi:hypothetical protein
MNTIQSNMLLKHIYPQLLPIYRYMRGLGIVMITMPLLEWCLQKLFPVAALGAAASMYDYLLFGLSIGAHAILASVLFTLLRIFYQPQKELINRYAYTLINYFPSFAAFMVTIMASLGYAPYIAPALLITCGVFFSLYIGQFSQSETQCAAFLVSTVVQSLIQGISGVVLVAYNIAYIWLPLMVGCGIFMIVMSIMMTQLITKKLREITDLSETEMLAAAASPERAQALEKIQEIQRAMGENFTAEVSSKYITTLGILCMVIPLYELLIAYVMGFVYSWMMSQGGMTPELWSVIMMSQRYIFYYVLLIWLWKNMPKPSEQLHPFAQKMLNSGRIFPVVAVAVAGMLGLIGHTDLVAPFMLIFGGCSLWLYGRVSLPVMHYFAYGFLGAGMVSLYLTVFHIPHLWMYLSTGAGLALFILGRIVPTRK